MTQSLLAGLVVALCFGYAAWTLMPAPWRAALQKWFTGRDASPSSGCGACGGCGGAKAPAQADRTVQVVHLHRHQAGNPH